MQEKYTLYPVCIWNARDEGKQLNGAAEMLIRGFGRRGANDGKTGAEKAFAYQDDGHMGSGFLDAVLNGMRFWPG